MSWTAPSTWVAGAVLTAAQLNQQLRDNMLAGGPIYATEALRDAAITSPFEGQRAYITGSTITAATGTTTAVPSGIATVYNGSAWVCTTVVGAVSPALGTLTGIVAFTPTLGGSPGTNATVTLSTGTTALVSMSLVCVPSATAMLQADISVSGATTLAAGSYLISTQWTTADAGFHKQLASTVTVTGLTAGTNTFTLNYSNNAAAATASFLNRRLVVQGIA